MAIDSEGGRLSLTKSMLSILQIILCPYMIPTLVANRLEKIQLLWKGSEDEFLISISWLKGDMQTH